MLTDTYHSDNPAAISAGSASPHVILAWDNSGSMSPSISKAKMLYQLLCQELRLLPKNHVSLSFFSSSQTAVPNLKADDTDMASYDKNMGCTDLSLLLKWIHEEINKRLNEMPNPSDIHIVILTDGMHNVSLDSALYEPIANIYRLIANAKDRCNFKFHFVYRGDYYAKRVISALSGLAVFDQVNYSLTDIDGIDFSKNTIDKLFGMVEDKAPLEIMKHLTVLKRHVPHHIQTDIHQLQLEYLKQFEELDKLDKDKFIGVDLQRQVKTYAELTPLLGSKTKSSLLSKLQAIMEGCKIDEVASNDEFINYLSGVERALPQDFDVVQAVQDFAVGNLRCIYNLLVDVHVLSTTHDEPDLYKVISLYEFVRQYQNNHKPYFLVVPKDESLPSYVLDQIQFDLLGTPGEAKNAQETIARDARVEFFYAVASCKTYLKDLLDITIDTIALHWKNKLKNIAASEPLGSKGAIVRYVEAMAQDLGLEQGAKQSYDLQNAVYAVPMIYCILMSEHTASDIFSLSHCPDKKLALPAVVGMLARFATDSKNFSLLTLTQTSFDLLKYANTVLPFLTSNVFKKFLKEKGYIAKKDKNTPFDKGDPLVFTNALNEYLEEINPVINILSASITRHERNMALYEVLVRKQQGLDGNNRQDFDLNKHQERRAALLLALAGVTDIESLCKQIRGLLSIFARKWSDTGELERELFEKIGRCISFGPKDAVARLLLHADSKYELRSYKTENGVETQNRLSPYSQAEKCLVFPAYVTSFDPLFEVPKYPRDSANWKDLFNSYGISPEAILAVNAIGEGDSLLAAASNIHRQMLGMNSDVFIILLNREVNKKAQKVLIPTCSARKQAIHPECNICSINNRVRSKYGEFEMRPAVLIMPNGGLTPFSVATNDEVTIAKLHKAVSQSDKLTENERIDFKNFIRVSKELQNSSGDALDLRNNLTNNAMDIDRKVTIHGEDRKESLVTILPEGGRKKVTVNKTGVQRSKSPVVFFHPAKRGLDSITNHSIEGEVGKIIKKAKTYGTA